MQKSWALIVFVLYNSHLKKTESAMILYSCLFLCFNCCKKICAWAVVWFCDSHLKNITFVIILYFYCCCSITLVLGELCLGLPHYPGPTSAPLVFRPCAGEVTSKVDSIDDWCHGFMLCFWSHCMSSALHRQWYFLHMLLHLSTLHFLFLCSQCAVLHLLEFMFPIHRWAVFCILNQRWGLENIQGPREYM